MRLTFPILLPALMLAGCGGTLNRSVESVHQPVVTPQEFALDLNAGPDGLAPGERQRLDAWLASMRPAYGDRVRVDDDGAAGFRVREDVADAAARHGLQLSQAEPIAAVPATPGTIRVVLARAIAQVPGCPDHSRTWSPNYAQHTSSDYGCAINGNLAAMVAQPEDLVRGRQSDGTVDVMVAVKAVQSLRDRKPTGEQGLAAVRTSSSGAQ